MRGTPILWSLAELKWVEAHTGEIRRVAHAAFCAKFGRTDVSLDAYAALCKRNGWLTGRTGRYEPGQAPANKGKRCPEGTGGRHANARRTQFRKGQSPHNTRHLGHERVSKDGYVEISIAETNPHTGYERRYVLKHRHLWQIANGPVPEGHSLKCLDGDRKNTDPSNWVAVPRGMLPRLSGRWSVPYDDAPDELKPAIMALAKLKHAAKAVRTKGKRKTDSPPPPREA